MEEVKESRAMSGFSSQSTHRSSSSSTSLPSVFSNPSSSSSSSSSFSNPTSTSIFGPSSSTFVSSSSASPFQSFYLSSNSNRFLSSIHVSSPSLPSSPGSTVTSSTITTTKPLEPALTSSMQFPASGVTSSTVPDVGLSASTAAAATPSNNCLATQISSSQAVASKISSSSSFSLFSNPKSTSTFGPPLFASPFQSSSLSSTSPIFVSYVPFPVYSSSLPSSGGSTVTSSLFSTITTIKPVEPALTSYMQFPSSGVTSSTPGGSKRKRRKVKFVDKRLEVVGISASTAAAATPSNTCSATQISSSQAVSSNSGVMANVAKVVGSETELPSETTGKTVEEVNPPPFPQEVGFVGLRTEAYRIPLLPPPLELVDFLNSHHKDEIVMVRFGVLQDMYQSFSSWEGLLSFFLSRSSDTRTLLGTYDRMAEASGVELTNSTCTGMGPWAVARSRVSSGTRSSNS